MEIRRRTEADFGPLVAMARRVRDTDGYPIYLPDDDFEGFLRRPEAIAAWVAVLDGSVAGHVCVNAETSEPVMKMVEARSDEQSAIYVARLLVDPDVRRRSIGRQLLQRAQAFAATNQHRAFLDVVDTPTANPAVALYRNAGWSEVGQVSFTLGGLSLDELVFVSPSRGNTA